VGNGWAIYEPSVWESNKTNCNLKYGDLPRRYPEGYVGDPATAIKALQRNLNYCYGSKLVVDGKYGSKTKAAVQTMQRRHKVTADGIYGPKTRAAMKWRMYNASQKTWSKACYDKF
jgi:peptidoglycan hydrolase-like protein with peptidoglycan-binding domain